MKLYLLIVCLCAQILLATPKGIPEPFPQFCPLSTPNYSKCTEKVFEKLGPILLKGVRQLNFPKLHPLEITSLSLDRTLNEFVSLSARLKNIQIWGFDTLRLESFEFDTKALEGKIHVFLPRLSPKFEFDIDGTLFGLNLDSTGFMRTNCSNVDIQCDFKLKKYEKLGIDYYGFEKFVGKLSIGDGDVTLISKNPNLQPTVDTIVDFYNLDHRRVLDATNPIYEEIFEVFFKSLAEQLLSNIPANELLPQ